MAGDNTNREELGRFLRSRRERITPAEVGLPTGPRRRTRGLRREEVAVLAGLSPTWYTYLEQGRDIRPSPEVLDSLARVLGLSEDERRYVHLLAHGQVVNPRPLRLDLPVQDLVDQLVGVTAQSSYPVYATNQYCDLIAWNKASAEWYDDWSRYPKAERNLLRWMLTTEVAKKRLPDWENDTRDVIARWRAEAGKWPEDERLRSLVAELDGLSPDFTRWWNDHHVQEHRSRIRRFQLPGRADRTLRIVPMHTPEIAPCGIVFHIPVESVGHSRGC
ncbi:helix-turn-helix transcriptional regulator [Amycolatopsis nigrescens]|uniref:helix-turn-helix transcriptional regulator n=1 Tax=Amycolatopsis nigrescens TaxID=381445 RepID=UPI0003622075|nr:helix-turn-helix transcriptional regulator [Amycolatopsis nigrescens]